MYTLTEGREGNTAVSFLAMSTVMFLAVTIFSIHVSKLHVFCRPSFSRGPLACLVRIRDVIDRHPFIFLKSVSSKMRDYSSRLHAARLYSFPPPTPLQTKATVAPRVRSTRFEFRALVNSLSLAFLCDRVLVSMRVLSPLKEARKASFVLFGRPLYHAPVYFRRRNNKEHTTRERMNRRGTKSLSSRRRNPANIVHPFLYLRACSMGRRTTRFRADSFP